MAEKVGFFRRMWNGFKVRLYLFNRFMRGVPILGIPWRIVSIWTDREGIYDTALSIGDEITEKLYDVADVAKDKLRRKKKPKR